MSYFEILLKKLTWLSQLHKIGPIMRCIGIAHLILFIVDLIAYKRPADGLDRITKQIEYHQEKHKAHHRQHCPLDTLHKSTVVLEHVEDTFGHGDKPVERQIAGEPHRTGVCKHTKVIVHKQEIRPKY